MSLNDSWKLFRHLVKVNVLFNYQIDHRPVYSLMNRKIDQLTK